MKYRGAYFEIEWNPENELIGYSFPREVFRMNCFLCKFI